MFHGSSPLTRGKQHPRHCRRGLHRLIPAHAGKTAPLLQLPQARAAHPRSRGENSARCMSAAGVVGSSPLTRGKLAGLLVFVGIFRLIPAHAGKTSLQTTCSSRHGAHPRSRGENYVDVVPSMKGFGSSPLTRGKPLHGDVPSHRKGLIPAHAGKTAHCGGLRPAHRAHPRSRGENSGSGAGCVWLLGSSPLTRGKLSDVADIRPRERLIPAHAGKTSVRAPWPGLAAAHPRSRGENNRAVGTARTSSGSSPLTRGKQPGARTHPHPRRLIPAHAGKTHEADRQAAPVGAHPRSRGENDPWIRGVLDRHGSSPLTRGKREDRCPQLDVERLIPAHAGKT